MASWITEDDTGDFQPAVDEMDGAGTSFGIPATATVDTPATYTASSPWQFDSPAPSTGWDFGDGGTASGDSVSHTYTTVGSQTVTATTTDGNGAENVATSTIDVVQKTQSIGFPAPGGGTVGGSESLSASGGGSGNPVVFTVDSSSSPANACSVSGTNGTTVTFAQAGSCVIDANQAGNSDYSAAPQRSQTIAVAAAALTTTNTTNVATTTTNVATTTTTTTTRTPTPTTTPPPVLGKSADVSKTSGTVRVELPGTHTFVTVSSSEQIPFGAVIDATQGTVTATIALPGGGTSTATFWAGDFTLSQSPSGALTATLVGGSFSGCPSSKKGAERSTRVRSARDTARSGKTRKKPGSPVRSLWSNAKGNFTHEGSERCGGGAWDDVVDP